jgi:hypothetical protein
MPVHEWIASLRSSVSSAQPEHCTTHVGRTLTLSFVLPAAALSVLGVVAFWYLGDVCVERDRDYDASDDDATLAAGGGRRRVVMQEHAQRLKLDMLFLGAATRLLLGTLPLAAWLWSPWSPAGAGWRERSVDWTAL